jgi:hypothetical protein
MAVTFAAARSGSSSTLVAEPYRVLVGDHVRRHVLAEMPAAELGYSDELNTPGSCAFKLPIEHPAVTPENVWPGNRVVFVERAGAVVWGGWIKTCRADASTVSVAAEGWWSYFRRRYRLGPWTWSNTDQLAIARGLLSVLEEDPDAMPAVDPSPATSGVRRDFVWVGHDKTAAAALEELMAMSGAFDVSFTFPWGDDGWPHPTLHLHYPYRGIRQATPLDVALPVVAVDVDVDASEVAASISVFGKDNPAYPDTPWQDRWAIERSDARDLGFPELQSVESARDVENLAELQALARRRMAHCSDAIARPSVSVATGGGGELETVGTGDTIHVVYRRGWADVDGWYRIMARSVAVGDDGTETTKFDLAPYDLAGGP